MYLSYLDKKVPKRWVLFFRWYLPFFKSPPSFYFTLRTFINEKKKNEDNFSIVTPGTWVEILKILEGSAKDNNSLEHLKEIIEGIPSEQLDGINGLFLEKLFTAFDPKNNNSLLTNLLDRLPSAVFSEYLDILRNHLASSKNTKAYCLSQLNWCEKLIDKFSIEGKLRLFAPMSDTVVMNCIVSIKKLLNFNSIFFKEVSLDTKKSIVKFCLKWKKELDIKDKDFFLLLAELSEFNLSAVALFIKENIPTILSKQRQFVFLKGSLELEKKVVFEIIFNSYPKEERSLLVNKLIIDYFCSPNDNSSHLLYFLQQEVSEKYPLNLFQILAIFTLTKQPFDMKMITEIYRAHFLLDTEAKAFTVNIQLAIINATILSIQDHISETVILKIPRKSEKYGIHRLWRQFKGEESTADPRASRVQLLGRVMEKMLIEVPEDKNAIVSFELLMALCRRLEENSELKELNNREKAQAEKQRTECEANEIRKMETRKLIAQGVPISPERMSEVFGEDAEQVRVASSKRGKGSFFHEEARKERNNDGRAFVRSVIF